MAKPPLVRAVVDSNLLIRGILRRRSQSVAVRLFAALIDRRFQLITSDYLLAEVDRTLREPDVRALASLSDAMIDAIIGELRQIGEVVAGALAVTLVPKDPKDNPIVACAIEGSGAWFVTDDRRDLLPLKVVRLAGYRPIQIVTPSAFLRTLGP